MATVSDLIHSSFRLIGAIAAGETLETDELNDAFVSFNQMIMLWNTEGLSLAERARVTMQLTTNNIYQLTNRPAHIDAASVNISNVDCPLEIVDAAGWEAITEKAATAVLIKKLYCDYGYPLPYVYLWPTPRIAGGWLDMFVYKPLTTFPTTDTVIDYAPGYEQALRYNFAIAILPEYPRSQVDPTLPAQAQSYKASIAQLNALNHARTPQPNLTAQAAQGTS